LTISGWDPSGFSQGPVIYSRDPIVHLRSHRATVGDKLHFVRWEQLIAPQEQRAKVYLSHGYVVGGVELEAGRYLVVHRKFVNDEGAYFYRLPYRSGQRSAAKMRTASLEGARIKRFTVNATLQPDGTFFVRSIQFPDSTELHSFERGQVYLPYAIGGVQLPKGNHLVVHNRSQEGKACMFFFRMPYRPGQEAAAKAHCTPVEGEAVKELTIRSTMQPDGSFLVRSIQFPGSMEVHTFEHGG